MATKRELPNLENATPAFLLDQIAIHREAQKEGKFWEGFYRNAFDARIAEGQTSIESDNNVGEIVEVDQERIDTDKVKSSYSHADLLKYGFLKVISFKTLKIVPKPKPKA
jgi:hypothetical protein